VTTLQWLADLTLHLDRHLVEMLARYDLWIYPLLFLIIFAETGLVVAPFLPGDSLLFACGALAAIDSSGTLRLSWLLLLLGAAAIGGNTLNYAIGRYIGPRAFDGQHRLFKLEHLRRAEEFFLRHGGFAIVLSRFIPVVRTFTPFVAGIGKMPVARFQMFNATGSAAWVTLFLCGGFLFGNLPVVKNNFGLVTLLIVAVSLLPLLWMMFREPRRPGRLRG
jgi:membrane-associated protein